MTRTPDEIKKGLECCARVGCCHTCPYDGECHSSHDDTCPMHMDALALIQQLQAEKAEQAETIMWMEAERDNLKRTIQQLEAERDAAVEDMHGRCPSCKDYDKDPKEEPCASCSSGYGNMDNWQWRGVQKEESDDGKE